MVKQKITMFLYYRSDHFLSVTNTDLVGEVQCHFKMLILNARNYKANALPAFVLTNIVQASQTLILFKTKNTHCV